MVSPNEYAHAISYDMIGFLRQVLGDEHMVEKATMHRDPRKGISTKYLAVRNRFVPVHPEDNLYRVSITMLALYPLMPMHACHSCALW
jgi:hypothetical protein